MSVADVGGRPGAPTFMAARDALAKQAAARFARRFVLFVPFGMALAGLSIGTGRAAYETPTGLVGVLLAAAMVIGCWLWSGRT